MRKLIQKDMNIKIKYAVITLGIIILQSVLKIYAIFLTKSLSLLSETIDTIVDILFIALTIYVLYLSDKPPDVEHMFGHEKIDPIGGLIQGIVLIMLYVYLIYNAFQIIILGGYEIENPGEGLIIIIISFSINIIYSRILIWQGRKQMSLSLEAQGLNLFQDSLRAILVVVSFSLALFGYGFLDAYFSIALSVIIIYGAFRLAKEGIKDLTDTNPIPPQILEKLKAQIFNLEHINGVEYVKARSSRQKLFINISLSVEDHISVVHANKTTRLIKSMFRNLFPLYDIEFTIQMSPVSGEPLLGDKIINLIHTMKAEYPKLIEIKNLNLFESQNKYFISMTIIVDQALTLNEAHHSCTEFEQQLKEDVQEISRVITHIESEEVIIPQKLEEITCETINKKDFEDIRRKIEAILKTHPEVKGYHGLECWSTFDYYIMEIHIFFKGDLNILVVHNLISQIEQQIRNLSILNLNELILHSEPLEGRRDGIIFD